jgi:acyl-CoA reductase-like NAD-dependent aldehyde dehydrogenase
MRMYHQGDIDHLYIGGRWVRPETGNRITVISPVTEQVFASVPDSSPPDIDRAVSAARAAFDAGPWPGMSLQDRVACVSALANLLDENRDHMGATITNEMGSPRALDWMQSDSLGNWLRAYVNVAQSYPFSVLRPCASGVARVDREPIGVVAAIVPWNVPVLIALQKMIPALLAGCAVVLKPAPESPLSANLLAELIDKCGFPEGVVSIVPAGREGSEYLVGHPGVDKVSFTGSSATGARVAQICGGQIKRCSLELGGKSAALILDDADIDQAVESLRRGSLRISGQACSNRTRLIVTRKREDELIEKFSGLMKSMPVGDPMDPATQIGPMVSERQRDRVEGYTAAGLTGGATLVMGGPGRPDGINRGWFVRPTIFTRVDPDSRIALEEIFGPTITVFTCDTVNQAVAMANHSDFGLASSVFSQDVDLAMSVASRIRAGVVEVNGNGIGMENPYGGYKKSGVGREAGPEGFEAYVEIKSIGVPRDYVMPAANKN